MALIGLDHYFITKFHIMLFTIPPLVSVLMTQFVVIPAGRLMVITARKNQNGVVIPPASLSETALRSCV